MGNLGGYQMLTTMAKKAGGPKALIGLFGSGCILLGCLAFAVVLVIKKKLTFKFKKKKKIEQAAVIYTVNAEGTSNEGLRFKVGDKFKVLDVVGDAGLIEIIRDNNSPYFVSLQFLSSISDYKND